MATLQQLLEALPNARRFYDLNLRSGFERAELVSELIAAAHVVKLNESEARVVSALFGLPGEPEGLCRQGAERFGWRAACVTLGERGCAIFDDGEFVHAEGHSVEVADTVGAGDAFAAAFLHGLLNGWPAEKIAGFANRVGALVASRPGAIPAWSVAEAARAMSRLNPHLLRSALAAAVGGLLFGFDTAVIAGTTRALTETYGLSPAMLGLTVSMALWGTVLGSSAAGPPADRYGRRGACRRWECYTSFPRWVAPLRGIGTRWCSSG